MRRTDAVTGTRELGGAGRGCQVKPDRAGPRHGVDRILTRPGGLPPLCGVIVTGAG